MRNARMAHPARSARRKGRTRLDRITRCNLQTAATGFRMTSSKSITLTRDCDGIAIPSGTSKTLPSGTQVRIMQSRGGSYTVATDSASLYRIDARNADALGLSAPPAAQFLPTGPLTEQMVI